VRLDSDGDVLLTGPAVSALAASCGPVDLLVSPSGRAAAELLPDVREVLVHDAPWTGYQPPPVDRAATGDLLQTLRGHAYERAVIFTSFHQSPLPMALLAKLAGVGFVAATCEDYPGSLLDVRHRRIGGHEVEAALDLAAASGATTPARPRLAVRRPLPDVSALRPAGPFVVVHPCASVPARSLRPGQARAVVDALRDAGHRVLVTGAADDAAVTAEASGGVDDLAGRTSLAELAALLDGAGCLVVGNTGPAHLAAAVGTPVVSLFAPVVPVERWGPYGVPSVVLGDQTAACRGSRARECPVPGHPCLESVTPHQVVDAVAALTGARATAGAGAR
jgi:ADP-heptose:LPS heptosyltransferase